MDLGLHVNSDERLEHVVELTKAALQKGHSVRIFVMDKGSCFLERTEFTSLCENENVTISFCEYNAKQSNIDVHKIDRKIKRGTQLNNAIMCQKSDKILVL